MRFQVLSQIALRKFFVLAIVIMVPVFAWSQKPSKPSAPSRPAAPAHAAPAQHAAPSAQHGPAPGGQRGGTQAGHTATTTGQRGGTQAGRTATTTGQRGGTQAGHTATTTGQRGGTQAGRTATTGQRGGTQAGHTTTAGRGAPGGRGQASQKMGDPHSPAGTKQVALKGGGTAHIRPNGQIRSVDHNGMHIERGVHGDRRVVSNRNGVRVVSNGRRGGYVQRAYVTRGGHSYYSRTYYNHGAYRTGVYRGYYYGGHPYYGYYPPYYYHPAYYGWAYNPWPAPVAYGWGWGAAPWYGYYGGYFAPYPVYPSAAFWITDFVLAASLQAAYEAQAQAAQDSGALLPITPDDVLVASLYPMVPAAAAEAVKLSPDVKKALAEEVKTLLAAEQAEAGKAGGSSSGGQPANSNEAPPALDANFRTFVVNADLSLVVDGQECALSQGDVVTRTTDTPDGDQNVNVKVAASNKSDCAIGKEGPVTVDDLQEMYNHFREQLKDGMGELAKKQGTGGLPKAPDTGTVAGDVPPPEPDKTAEKSLQDQQSAADQAETEVKQEAGSGGGLQ